eukprot:3571975-Pyramimonas_sp.AAC.1
MMLALAARELHKSYRPCEPHWHDAAHFHSEWLMEPDIGVRPWMACDAVDASIRELFGSEA